MCVYHHIVIQIPSLCKPFDFPRNRAPIFQKLLKEIYGSKLVKSNVGGLLDKK